MSTVISVERLCKTYQLGAIGGATLRSDVSRWLANLRGKPDPNLQIGQENQARLRGQEFKALRDVSFEVEQGEILGIIGRNGAGKSTLLKVLSRVTAPTSGEVKVKGRIASLLEVGTGFHPELTGRENIFLNGAILGMTKAEIRKNFDEIVDFSGVEQFIDTPVKRYSSGMYVRLAFAVAAHLEPEILIVDEVLAVGDAEFQKKCMGKMQDVSKHGRTILFVSHQIASVTRLCKNVLWLDGGKFKDYGQADLICSEYMANGSIAKAKREWKNDEKAPGNEWVRLIGAEVHSEGKVANQVGIDQPVEIHMDYAVLREGKVLIPNIHFFADDGTLIFIAHDWYSGWRTRPRQLGKYKTVFNIPGNFFSEGRITIKVVVSTYTPFQVHFEEFDVIAFTVVEVESNNTSRGDYAGHIPGVIRPLIESKTTLVA
jgi:lipopolysaccharide transport system ATP-binding protein